MSDPLLEDKREIDAPLNHPCYIGDFPRNPVVPGVLLLEWVVEALGRGAPRAVTSVKFHRVLKPGESFELSVRSAGVKSTFRCMRGPDLLADGTLEFGPVT
jgi:3-hydroxymyristoyl/3-hydroxydecanoyl-(acyl carrier protein) dehydratase